MMSHLSKKTSSFFIIIILVGFSFTSINVCAFNIENDVSKDHYRETIDIDDDIKTLIKQAKFPSVSVGIVKNDSIVWNNGYGKYNRFLRLSPTKDTIYMAGSISKAIATMALMQLYENGLFDLDDDINNYLPFPLRNPYHSEVPITFKMVLSHQSSLPITGPIQILHIMKAYLLNFPKFSYPNFEEYLIPGGRAYNSGAWTDNKPGDAFNYSNTGFMLVEYLVELLSKQDYKKYCKDNIFEPLKMYNTSFNIRDFKRFNRAVPYTQIGIFLARFPFYNVPSAGAGGLISTIEDLSHFLIAHMNNGTYDGVKILKNSTIKLIHTLHYYHELNEYYDFQYGLGWMFFNKSGIMYQGHHGDTVGYAARMLFRESDKAGAIILINKWPGPLSFKNKVLFPEAIKQIFDLLFLKSEEF